MPRDETLASVRADTREDEMPPAALPDDDPNRAEYVSERLERTERTERCGEVGPPEGDANGRDRQGVLPRAGSYGMWSEVPYTGLGRFGG